MQKLIFLFLFSIVTVCQWVFNSHIYINREKRKNQQIVFVFYLLSLSLSNLVKAIREICAWLFLCKRKSQVKFFKWTERQIDNQWVWVHTHIALRKVQNNSIQHCTESTNKSFDCFGKFCFFVFTFDFLKFQSEKTPLSVCNFEQCVAFAKPS